MTALLTVWLVGFVMFAWWAFFKSIPSSAASRFRYRLWAMRDELALELLDGTYEDSEQPQRLLHEIEALIRVAPELTLFRMGLMRLGRIGISPLPSYQPIKLEALNNSDRQRLAGRMDRVSRAALRYLFTGSPSGWLATVLLVLLVVPIEAIRRLVTRDKDSDDPPLIEYTKARARDEVDLDLAETLAILIDQRRIRRHRLRTRTSH